MWRVCICVCVLLPLKITFQFGCLSALAQDFAGGKQGACGLWWAWLHTRLLSASNLAMCLWPICAIFGTFV